MIKLKNQPSIKSSSNKRINIFYDYVENEVVEANF